MIDMLKSWRRYARKRGRQGLWLQWLAEHPYRIKRIYVETDEGYKNTKVIFELKDATPILVKVSRAS